MSKATHKGINVNAQEYSLWKHKLHHGQLGRSVSESLFSKYHDQMDVLRDIDNNMRQIALGDNRHNAAFKQTLSQAKEAASKHKLIDAIYFVGIIADIHSEMVARTKDDLDRMRGQLFESLSETDELGSVYQADFSQKEYEQSQKKEAQMQWLYKSLFGDPLQKAWAKELNKYTVPVQKLIRNAEAHVTKLLSIFDQMGVARASGKIDDWIKGYETIMKMQLPFSAQVGATYHAIKPIIEYAAKNNTGSRNLTVQLGDPKAAAEMSNAYSGPNLSPEMRKSIKTNVENINEEIKNQRQNLPEEQRFTGWKPSWLSPDKETSDPIPSEPMPDASSVEPAPTKPERGRPRGSVRQKDPSEFVKDTDPEQLWAMVNKLSDDNKILLSDVLQDAIDGTRGSVRDEEGDVVGAITETGVMAAGVGIPSELWDEFFSRLQVTDSTDEEEVVGEFDVEFDERDDKTGVRDLYDDEYDVLNYLLAVSDELGLVDPSLSTVDMLEQTGSYITKERFDEIIKGLKKDKIIATTPDGIKLSPRNVTRHLAEHEKDKSLERKMTGKTSPKIPPSQEVVPVEPEASIETVAPESVVTDPPGDADVVVPAPAEPISPIALYKHLEENAKDDGTVQHLIGSDAKVEALAKTLKTTSDAIRSAIGELVGENKMRLVGNNVFVGAPVEPPVAPEAPSKAPSAVKPTKAPETPKAPVAPVTAPKAPVAPVAPASPESKSVGIDLPENLPKDGIGTGSTNVLYIVSDELGSSDNVSLRIQREIKRKFLESHPIPIPEDDIKVETVKPHTIKHDLEYIQEGKLGMDQYRVIGITDVGIIDDPKIFGNEKSEYMADARKLKGRYNYVAQLAPLPIEDSVEDIIDPPAPEPTPPKTTIPAPVAPEPVEPPLSKKEERAKELDSESATRTQVEKVRKIIASKSVGSKFSIDDIVKLTKLPKATVIDALAQLVKSTHVKFVDDNTVERDVGPRRGRKPKQAPSAPTPEPIPEPTPEPTPEAVLETPDDIPEEVSEDASEVTTPTREEYDIMTYLLGQADDKGKISPSMNVNKLVDETGVSGERFNEIVDILRSSNVLSITSAGIKLDLEAVNQQIDRYETENAMDDVLDDTPIPEAAEATPVIPEVAPDELEDDSDVVVSKSTTGEGEDEEELPVLAKVDKKMTEDFLTDPITSTDTKKVRTWKDADAVALLHGPAYQGSGKAPRLLGAQMEAAKSAISKALNKRVEFYGDLGALQRRLKMTAVDGDKYIVYNFDPKMVTYMDNPNYSESKSSKPKTKRQEDLPRELRQVPPSSSNQPVKKRPKPPTAEASVDNALLKLSHKRFYDSLKKAPDIFVMANMMLNYSSKMEDRDPELSIKLLLKAKDILDA